MLLTSKIRWILICSLVCGLPAQISRAAPSGFSVDHLLKMERLASPRISPDGRLVVFTRSSVDLESNSLRSDLWIINSDGTGLRRLTTHPASDHSPQWSADGSSIYFLSSRSGSTQVWNLPLNGGEARQVTKLPLPVSNLVLSPTGDHLAVTLEVYPQCAELSCTLDKVEAVEKQAHTGQIYDRLFVRHWDRWKDGRRSHLFVIPIEGGDPQNVMAGMQADTPAQPFGGAEEITFSPDGTSILFTARVGNNEAWSTNFDIYQAPIDASQPPQSITSQNLAWDTHPAFSPDGRKLAYLAMERPGYESDRFRIVVRDWPNGTSSVLTEAWDRSPHSLTWSHDSKHLYATAFSLGQVSLFAIDASSGEAEALVEEGTVSAPTVFQDRIVYLWDHLNSPAEIYTISAGKPDPRPLTSINAERLAEAKMGEPEQFSFSGWNGETVYGYVVQPVDFDPNQKYPVAFLIHGGPQGSFGNHFHYRWNPQVYAGAGYGVVMVDFHGSIGYGQEFVDSIRNDWGGKPLEDLQKGLDAALERYPWMDPDNVAALGASYGGYMVNWIAGNWPDRFRCLVNHDGAFDMRSMYYSTEELWFLEWEMGGPYWSNAENYEKHNPARFVNQWKTPMLVVHGALDFRVPLEQSLATFTALQRRGIPSRLLYFPDENHWVLKPQNSIQWHNTVLEWLKRWIER